MTMKNYKFCGMATLTSAAGAAIGAIIAALIGIVLPLEIPLVRMIYM